MGAPINSHKRADRVRASQILRSRRTWLLPLILASLLISAIGAIYIGSVANPTGHVHDLPVVIVNQDTGAVDDGRPINIGTDIV